MIRKSVFISVLLVILTVGMLGGSTNAYFTDTQVPPAEINTGNAAITVEVTDQGSKEKDGGHKGKFEEKQSDSQIRCEPDCDDDDDQKYYVEWTITNTGTTPVTLQAKLSEKWLFVGSKTKGTETVEKGWQRPSQPKIDPEPVSKWSYSSKKATYYYRSYKNRKSRDIVVEPGSKATFYLVFQVKGNAASLKNYKLNLSLNVTATQVIRNAGHSTMEADEST
jgi:predicted ribosomally synthesized peptide with SipW-like signal peptide